MAQYIDKSALVAEIGRLENKLYYDPDNFKDVGAKMALDSLKSFLNTLEVKEVDLEKEIDRWYNEEAPVEFENVLYRDIEKFAEYFYNLGLAQKGEKVRLYILDVGHKRLYFY